jgi:hypothetical protein
MKINFDLEFTATIVLGYLVVMFGLVSMFVINDANLATTCILTGAGLCGVGKIANTAYDNAHKV